jgi:hypothetical protein
LLEFPVPGHEAVEGRKVDETGSGTTKFTLINLELTFYYRKDNSLEEYKTDVQAY